jgi:hypothetical protein
LLATKEENRNMFLVGKPVGKGTLVRPRPTRKDKFKISLTGIVNRVRWYGLDLFGSR